MRMKTRKTRLKDRNAIVYVDAFGKKTIIREGDFSFYDNKKVTKEDIARYYRDEDLEVLNNLEQTRAMLSEEEEKKARESEQPHPGETAPNRYHARLDQFSDDPDSDMDRSYLAKEISEHEEKVPPTVECLREILEKMPEKYRYCLVQVKFNGYTLKEVAEERNVEESTACRWLHRAIEIIKKNEERFRFR